MGGVQPNNQTADRALLSENDVEESIFLWVDNGTAVVLLRAIQIGCAVINETGSDAELALSDVVCLGLLLYGVECDYSKTRPRALCVISLSGSFLLDDFLIPVYERSNDSEFGHRTGSDFIGRIFSAKPLYFEKTSVKENPLIGFV